MILPKWRAGGSLTSQNFQDSNSRGGWAAYGSENKWVSYGSALDTGYNSWASFASGRHSMASWRSWGSLNL